MISSKKLEMIQKLLYHSLSSSATDVKPRRGLLGSGENLNFLLTRKFHGVVADTDLKDEN
jgi:hypothetical protein